MARIASVTAWVAFLAAAAVAWAAEVKFSAQADRPSISLDDSVSVSFTISIEGSGSFGEVRFQAPDFDVVNEYSNSFIQSFYDSNTGFKTVNSRKITKVLRPRHTGRLLIRGIQAMVDGSPHAAPDLAIVVVPGGQGTPPPRNYGGGGVGLRGAAKRPAGASVFVRAEVDKDKVVKGEQVVVSYYLYRRVRMFNIQVDKFPELKGFLREELEMPIMGQRLDQERVILDGVPYDRSLLVRYAAYPLQEGKLKLDPLGLKYNYYTGASDDGEDPFLQFFQQMTPRVGSSRSEVAQVEVAPLPSEGRPSSFSGGVGDFNVTSAVDKYEVRANEALTLTVKVEGRGNVAAIGEPKVAWPSGLEFYDSKGEAKGTGGGVGTKVFEFVLIPRAPGKFDIPPIEFSFFDPVRKTYVTRQTEPTGIQVQPTAPGSAAPAPRQSGVQSAAPTGQGQSPQGLEIRDLKLPASLGESATDGKIWHWLYLASLLGSGLIIFTLAWGGLKGLIRGRLEKFQSAGRTGGGKNWKTLDKLQAQANQASELPWLEVSKTYDQLGGVVLDAIGLTYGIGARSHSRTELREILVTERGLPESIWERIGRLLEFTETVRFASSAGAVSEASARRELKQWVSEAEAIVQDLERRSLEKQSPAKG